MLNKLKTALIIAVCAAVALSAVFAVRGRTVSVFQPAGSVRVIIDAGHGGTDGGAVGVSGVYESDINLAVALKTETVLAFLGCEPVMTRRTADIDYPADAETLRQKKNSDQKNRAELIKSTENGVLISIHQNKYTSPSPSGAHVFYGASEGSTELAECVERGLRAAIGEDSVRDMKQISPDIYLMKAASCPAVLVECGFLSNPSDEKKLTDGKYQTRLAVALAAGFAEYASGVDKYEEEIQYEHP